MSYDEARSECNVILGLMMYMSICEWLGNVF